MSVISPASETIFVHTRTDSHHGYFTARSFNCPLMGNQADLDENWVENKSSEGSGFSGCEEILIPSG